MAENSGISVSVEKIGFESIFGYYDKDAEKIVLASNLSDSQRAKAMAREYANALIDKTTTQNAYIAEFEANCLYLKFCEKFGFDSEELMLKAPAKHDIVQSLTRVDKAYNFTLKGFIKTAEEKLCANKTVIWKITKSATASRIGQENRRHSTIVGCRLFFHV